ISSAAAIPDTEMSARLRQKCRLRPQWSTTSRPPSPSLLHSPHRTIVSLNSIRSMVWVARRSINLTESARTTLCDSYVRIDSEQRTSSPLTKLGLNHEDQSRLLATANSLRHSLAE